MFDENDRVLDDEIPSFDDNYTMAQDALPSKEVKRKDMPVINNDDVKGFKKSLENGYLGIVEPYDETFEDNPFPRGLDPNSDLAKEWLKSGLQKFDKADDPEDDAVDCEYANVQVGKLKPIQSQIYVDKSLKFTAKDGVKKTKQWLSSDDNCFIISEDNYIIDGHHRWLSGMLIDPNVKVHCLKIKLPIADLLKVACTYGDAIGNQPNQ